MSNAIDVLKACLPYSFSFLHGAQGNIPYFPLCDGDPPVYESLIEAIHILEEEKQEANSEVL